MKTWSKAECVNLGDSVAEMGVPVVWQKWNIEPSEKVKTDEGEMIQLDALMRAISNAKGISITHARRAMEDVIAMATKNQLATKEWLIAALTQMERWHCSQSWLEKNLKRLAENSEDGSALAAFSSWASMLTTKDQKAVLDSLTMYYEQQKQKNAKEKAKPVQKEEGFLGLANLGSVWGFAGKTS